MRVCTHRYVVQEGEVQLEFAKTEGELTKVIQAMDSSGVYKSVSEIYGNNAEGAGEIVEVGGAILDTVQLVKCRFQVRKTVQFGKGVRVDIG